MTDTPQVLLAHHLKTLKLPTFLREYDKVARQCAAEGVDYPRYLLRLAELELIDRERRMVERRIKAAKFPTVKSLDSFDFAAFPSLNKALVMELARSEYVARRENIIAVGNSGTGKTYIGLDFVSQPARKACQAEFGHRRVFCGIRRRRIRRILPAAVPRAPHRSAAPPAIAAQSPTGRRRNSPTAQPDHPEIPGSRGAGRDYPCRPDGR